MRVGIIGGGISGLTAATLLLDHGCADITILERDAVIGGRANVRDGAEHCQRLFISNYEEMFALLDRIPSGSSSLLSKLQPVTRMIMSGQEWKQIDHLYAIWSRELGFFEKYRIIRARQKSALLSEKGPARKKAIRVIVNLRPQELVSVLKASKTAQGLWCLPGATDENLIHPWIRFLRDQGVIFETSRGVKTIHQDSEWPRIRVVFDDATSETYDAVFCATMPHDMAEILDQSGIKHRVPRIQNNLNFKVATFECESLTGTGNNLPDYALLAHNGLTVFLQKPSMRATCFFTSPMSPSDSDMQERVEEMMGQFGQLRMVGIRDNAMPHEAIYSSRSVDAERCVPRLANFYIAGSATRSGYPGDSGEAAVRSARIAVQRFVYERLVKQDDAS